MNVLLQGCLHCHIKDKSKQATELVKHGVFEKSHPLQRSVEQLLSNCYCLRKGEITIKAIVVVYIKL